MKRRHLINRGTRRYRPLVGVEKMFNINWDYFNIKNPNKENSFEEMCRHLFCRKFGITGYDFQSNYNQTGLEMEPIKVNGKWYGFQSKYVKNNPYQQIEDSLCKENKAFDIYKGRLDCVYIYTNANIKPNCIKKDLEKDTARTRIIKRAKRENIELIWITRDNFNSILNEDGNMDIAAFYFGIGKEIGFINNCISKEDVEFLNSEKYLDLVIRNKRYETTAIDNIIHKKEISLLVGDPGTGKSEILKKIYLKYSNAHASDREIIMKILENKILPIFIQLREMVYDNLENFIRSRMADFGLKIYDKSFTYLYIIDGIDEVSFTQAHNVSLFIKKLYNESTTYSILLSSRSNSPNITILKSVIMNIDEYYIEKLNQSYIDIYFKVQKNKDKELCYKSIKEMNIRLLKELDDIFSIKLLYDNIEKINIKTTKIELISESVKLLLNGPQIEKLNILDNKADKLIAICREIAAEMQRNQRLSIDLPALQVIIVKNIPYINNYDLNCIVTYLRNIFFSTSEQSSLSTVFNFKHRRYQEYFLYEKVKVEFKKNPRIIRELKLLSNKGFMLDIFLPQMICDCKSSGDMLGILSISFLWDYLGYSYWYKWDNPQLPLRNDWGSSEPEYKLSELLLSTIASQKQTTLDLLLKDENLPISDYLNDKKRWLRALELFHRNGHEKQVEYYLNLLSKQSKEDQRELIFGNSYSFIYYRYKIMGISLTDIMKNLPDISNDNSVDGYESIESPLKSMIRAFYKVIFEFSPNFFINSLNEIPISHLNILCDEMCKFKNLLIFINNDELKEAMRHLVSQADESFDISVHVIRKLLNNAETSDQLIENYFKSINTGNIPTWDRRQNVNVLLSAVYEKQNLILYSSGKMQTKILKIVIDNYGKNEITMMNEIVTLIAETNKMNSFEVSKLVGILLSYVSLPLNKIKKYLVVLSRYAEKVNIATIIYYIQENNPGLFIQISNPGMIMRLYNKVKDEGIISYYGDYTENLLRFAKMMNNFDFERSYLIIRECINAGILRPCFRKEDIVDYVLCDCFKIAIENFWYSEEELKVIASKLRNMIILLQDSTDGGGRSNYFNYILKEYIPNLYEEYSINGGETSYSEKIEEVTCSIEEVSQSLSMKNIKDYYIGKISVDYSSKALWELLISYELKETGKLDILFECLNENHYPFIWGFGNCEYHHIPTAILWDNPDWACKIKDFMMEQGGRAGLYNVIKMCSIIGNDEMGKKYFEQFIKLCELIVFE